MTPEDFDAQFDQPFRTVVRMELGSGKPVGAAEQARLDAWRRGEPRPERSVRTSSWLARIATSTVVEQKDWHRLRVVDDPLTEYQRYRLHGDVESQAVGEQVRIAVRTEVQEWLEGDDFWLFDGPEGWAVVMYYDDEGRWDGAEWTADPLLLRAMARRGREIEKRSTPLNAFLARTALGA